MRRLYLGPSLYAGALAGAAFVAAALLAGRWPLLLIIAIAAAVAVLVHLQLREAIARPLRTAETLIDAIRSGNYSMRARDAGAAEPLAELLAELNGLGEHLRRERLRAEETRALLEAIVARTEVALFAFDDDGLLTWTNPAADLLLPETKGPRSAAALGVAGWLTGARDTTVTVPGQPPERVWQLHRGTLWLERRRYVFFMLVDSRRVRRQEERIAWQRLIRVIGHEVNSTLAPLQSLASTCLDLLRDEPSAAAPSLERALTVIEQRAGSLHHFIGEYTRLARLPPLEFHPTRLEDCIRVAVEQEAGRVRLIAGPEVTLDADAAQLEQALVNLIRNAVEAAAETSGGSAIDWCVAGEAVLITLIDEGPGIENPENLFVPFFSTKPGGSGIGLALARNIIEGHGGELTIANRSEAKGCIVRVRLPLRQAEPV